MTGAFALSVFVAVAALTVLAVLGVYAFRNAGQSGKNGLLWRSALVLVGALLAWVLLDRSSTGEFAAERRAIEARAAELTARAIAPGSSLACLDAVANAAVETACERSLFATPEATAAALAYVDARISLLAPSMALADRDPNYRPSVERLRRMIEADRFGLVAQVLMTRGCNSTDCADLKLLRDPKHILANMTTRAFDGHVQAHAAAWHPNGAGGPAESPNAPPVAAVALPPSVATAPLPPSVALTPAPPPDATTGAARAASPATSKYDFPSAASIPAVSIMNPEPSAPPAAEPRAAQAPPKRTPAQPARRQSAREPPQPNSPPLAVVPQAPPQTSGAR